MQNNTLCQLLKYQEKKTMAAKHPTTSKILYLFLDERLGA